MQNQNRKENNSDYLFAPWRMDYIKSPNNRDNVFELPDSRDNYREKLILFKANQSFIIMNLYPYNNGHLMIVPYRKVNSMVDLNKDELKEIMNLSQHSMRIIKKTLNADGFNFGLNVGRCSGAGIDDHMHFHIVPRWNGDNNFMPVTGNTKVIVQGLKDTYDLLHLSFKKIS